MEQSMTSRRFLAWIVWLIGLPLMVACGGSYYQITDTGSGKSYYTRDIDRDEGHIRFTDKASGDKVNLDSFEVRKITEQQYQNAVRK